MACLNADALSAFVLLPKMRTGIGKFEWADTDFIAYLEYLVSDQATIDIDVIGTASILNAIGRIFAYQFCMVSRDLRVIEFNAIARDATDSDVGLIQGNRVNSRHGIRDATTIVVGKRDQCTEFITNTEDITTCKHMPELLITLVMTSLMEQAVGSFWIAGSRVEKDELIIFMDNLQVEARDNALINHHIVRAISPNIDDRLG